MNDYGDGLWNLSWEGRGEDMGGGTGRLNCWNVIYYNRIRLEKESNI